jgi:polyphenol oxidase
VTHDPHWLVPDWSADGVGALMTTRDGGISAAPFDHMNLRDGIGDDAAAVLHNRALLAAAIGARPIYLDQRHGCHVLRLAGADAQAAADRVAADASVTTERGLACVVQVADCLPVLFAAPMGRAVGAAHAGWRGLAAGVLEATLRAVCDAAQCRSADVRCWLGPCIGPRRFEVGADVLAAFGVGPGQCVSPAFRPLRDGKWLADLPGLARDRLRVAGARALYGGRWCTFDESSRFFSYRRERTTGRMAAAIWIERPR